MPSDIVFDKYILFWHPAFLLYTASAVAVALVLILYCAPRYGQTNILVYIGICSIIGSLTVSGVPCTLFVNIESYNSFILFIMYCLQCFVLHF